jgi:sodium/potassium-transporting ATPase subunit alpha
MKKSEQTSENRPAAIHFSDLQKKRNGETSAEMKRRMRRTPSTASHAIIAYRTLSITVSEHQAKGVKTPKKPKKELAEGKFIITSETTDQRAFD